MATTAYAVGTYLLGISLSIMELFSQGPVHFDLPDAEVILWKQAFHPEEAQQLFNELRQHLAWRQDDIKVFGKVYPQPRLTALYASNHAPYSYSNITMYPHPFNETLLGIKKKVEDVTEASFTTCLCNLYRDGKDSNGWHADDEKELGRNPEIASVSFGETRVFKMRHREDKTRKIDILLPSGSLLFMKGTTQHYWQHQIPKTAKPIAPRINLTFRKLIN